MYTKWLEASRAIIGFSGVIHKAFTNMIEAEEIYANFK
ncbi:viroplasmin family protein, partial [Candidatus Liberibacter asiaticus]